MRVARGGGSETNQIVRITDVVTTLRGRNPSTDERRKFIDWMFAHRDELRVDSKIKLATKAINKYLSQTGIRMNKDWLYAMIRLGIYHDEDGYHFEENCKYSFEELCEHPSYIRKID